MRGAVHHPVMRLMTAFLVLIAMPALAEDAVCPPVSDRQAEKFALLGELAISRDATEASLIAGFLWQIWTDAPDDAAQALLDEGMALRLRGDLAASVATLDGLVAYCPDYAEGWNQRAFSSYLQRDFAAALTDLDTAIALDPHHVPAISGKALTLFGLGRDDEAQDVLRQALALNPWLSERALLQEPDGTNI
jgi:tetratricopeptide (TPR) repeat protein